MFEDLALDRNRDQTLGIPLCFVFCLVRTVLDKLGKIKKCKAQRVQIDSNMFQRLNKHVLENIRTYKKIVALLGLTISLSVATKVLKPFSIA